MKANDIQNIEKTSGGSIGYNKYPRELYHEACFLTKYNLILYDRFWLRLTLTERSLAMTESEANKYVDYYLSHTADEYLKFIQRVFPSCTELHHGFIVEG